MPAQNSFFQQVGFWIDWLNAFLFTKYFFLLFLNTFKLWPLSGGKQIRRDSKAHPPPPSPSPCNEVFNRLFILILTKFDGGVIDYEWRNHWYSCIRCFVNWCSNWFVYIWCVDYYAFILEKEGLLKEGIMDMPSTFLPEAMAPIIRFMYTGRSILIKHVERFSEFWP